MLVLSRRKDESLRIGDDIVIRVLRIKGSSVRLSIEAPRNLKILRAELELKPKEEEKP